MKNRALVDNPNPGYSFPDHRFDPLLSNPGAGTIVKSPLAPQDVRITDRDAITPQESNVALLVAQGKTNSEIAATLFLTPGTVRNYVSSVLSKLYLPNRAALAVYVVRHDMSTAQPARVTDPDCYRELIFLAYA